MRRAQIDKSSQIIKNFAYNPSFEAAGISTLLRTNIATNPSLETAGATQAVRTNLLTNPSAETASGTVNVRTNLITNPSFEAASGVTNVRTNFIANPSFEGSSGTVTTRTNLHSNPSVATSYSPGWSTYGGGNTHPDLVTSRAAATWSLSGWAYQVQGTATSTVNMAEIGLGDYTAAPGTSFTASIYLIASSARKARFRFRGIGGGGDTFSADVTLSATTPTRLSFTGTVPTGATGLSINIKEASTPDPFGASDWIAGSMALVEQTAGLMPFFDGTIPAAQNLAKTATTALTGMTITTGVSYGGSTWSRAAVAAGTGGWIARQYVALNELIQGETYTASVTVANDQAFSQAVVIDWTDMGATTYTIAPGEVRRLVVTSTRNPYTDTYRFADLQVNQSATEGRSILFKDWLIELGTTTGEYYTGTGDYTYAWTGTANASTSTQRATGLSFWSPTSTGVPFRSSTQKLSIGYSAGVATKGLYGDGMYVADVSGIATGNSYTFSAWVKATTSHPLTVDFRWKDSGQAIISDTLVSVTPTVGVWTRISATAVAPTGSPVYLQTMLRVFASHTATIFYVDDALLERASGVGTYFDGATPASGDFTYAWVTTAHASYSYQQAPIITGWANRWFGNGGGNGALYQAIGGVTGKYARKVWTTANTGATMDAGINPNTNIAVSPNTPYTISAWVRTSVAQNYNFYIEWKDATPTSIGVTPQNTSIAVTANTWTRLSVTGTSPANAAFAVPVIGPYANGLTMPYGSTMDFDNVLFEAAPGMQDYFDGANAIQNICTNPSLETDFSSWNNVNGGVVSRVTSEKYFGSAAGRVALPTYLGQAGTGFTISTGVVGLTYTASVWVKTSVANKVAVQIGLSQSAQKHTGSGNWERLSHTAVLTSSVVSFYIVANDPTAGMEFFFDGMLIEQTSTVNPYYEGTGDFTYVWSGTANASTSLQQAPGVTGASSVYYLGNAYQSKTYGITSGTKSIRVTPTHASNGDSFVEVNSMLSGYTFKANTTYTISGNRTILAPQTNIAGTTHFRINVGSELTPTLVASVANVAGTQRVVGRFTTGSGTALGFIRFYNGSYFGGGDVWWDDIVLEEGTTNGQYFDGANPIQNLCTNPSFETNFTGWSGNALVAGYGRVSTRGFIGNSSAWGVAPDVAGDSMIVTTSNITVQPATTYTVSAYVWIPAGVTAAQFRDGTRNFWAVAWNGSTPTIAAVNFDFTKTNQWQRVSTTVTTPNPTTGLQVRLYCPANSLGIYWDGVLVEKMTTLNPFYEGTGDFTYAWNGTANASVSEQRAPLIVDRIGVPTNAAVYQSNVRALSGAKSGAILTRNQIFSDGTLMYPQVEYLVGAGAGQLTASVKNTWSLWVWVPSGSGTVFLKDVTSNTSGAPNTLFDQWERISVTFIGQPATQHVLRLRAWTTVPAGTTIWWDNELIEASAGVGSYFDGATASNSEFTHAWTGTANASTSTQKIMSLPNSAAYRDTGGQIDSKFYVYQTVDESGKKIARWVAPAGTPNSGWRIAGFPSTAFEYPSIKAGGRYTLFFRWRSSGWGTNTNMSVQISTSGATNHVINNDGVKALSQSPTLSQWQEYRRTFTALRDADNIQMVYISLPPIPSPTMDGIFDLRDWMLVEGEYTGDYIDGTKPLSKWNGTAHASSSIGYQPQLIDIAGAPLFNGTDLPIGSTYTIPSGPITVYTVQSLGMSTNNPGYWEYSTTGAWNTSTGIVRLIGSLPTMGRLDHIKPAGGGNNLSVLLDPMNLAVTATALDPTVSGTSYQTNGGATYNVSADATYREASGGTLKIGVRDNGSQSAPVVTKRVLIYTGKHDLTTRQAISRYLGNKYGINVA